MHLVEPGIVSIPSWSSPHCLPPWALLAEVRRDEHDLNEHERQQGR